MTDQIMETLTNEEHERLLLMSEHAIAPPLSPAAQAVLNAFMDSPVDAGNYYATRSRQIAAALRTVADQVVPVQLHPQAYEDCCQYSDVQTRAGIRAQLLAIAAELEAQ